MALTLSRVLKSRFSIVVAASAIGQAVAVGFSPVLTRYYSPADIGLYGIYTSITAALAMIATARYEFALPLAVQISKTAPVIWLAFLGTLSFVGMAVVCLLVSLPWLDSLFGTPLATGYFALVIVTVGVLAIWQTLLQFAVAQRRISAIASSQILRPAAIAAGQIGTALAGWHAYGLFIGQLAGLALGAAVLLRGVPAKLMCAVPSRAELGWALKTYADFPKYNLSRNLLIALSLALTPVLFGSLFDNETAGYYWLAYKVLNLPAAVITDSIRPLLTEHYAALGKKNLLRRNTLLVHFGGLLLLFLPVLLTIVFFAPELFSIVFGKNWETAGTMSQFVVLTALAAFTSAPFGAVMTILGRQKYYFYLQILISLVGAAILFLGAAVGSPIETVMWHSIATSGLSLSSYAFAYYELLKWEKLK